jgi:hypothetical protein
MSARRPRGAVYELTVVGRLGPVLQAMLEPPAAVTSCQTQTSVCLRGEDGRDLMDILLMLRSRGLEATAIRLVD